MKNAEITAFFLTLVVLLAAAHGVGYFCQRRLRVPRVVGEIGAGILLGPSLLGWLAPPVHTYLFNAFPEEAKLTATLHWIGMVLLMFVAGFRVRADLDVQDRRLVGFLVLTATFLPFLAGLAAAGILDWSSMAGPAATPASFALIMAIAVAVTSIPVISRIFIELDMMRSRFARVVLTVATLEDILLWAALAVATGLATEGMGKDFPSLALSVTLPIIFLLVSLAAGPWLFLKITTARLNLIVKASPIGYVLLICFLFAAFASLLDMNLAFGALAAGMIVGSIPGEKFDRARSDISDVALGFFVPIYFALVGARIDLGSHFDVVQLLLFLVASSLIKMGSAMIGARLGGKSLLPAFNLAIALNTRGGPGIVLATVALEFRLISETFFTTLVIASLASSAMSGLWLRYVKSRNLLEQEE